MKSLDLSFILTDRTILLNMSFTIKGDGQYHPSAPRIEPEDHEYMSLPSPPTYGEIRRAELNNFLLVTCDICGEEHPLKADCLTKPSHPPASYYPQCSICAGFHPRNRCWFEYMREFLFKPTHCNSCNVVHIGFCKTALFCQYCRRRHNFADSCQPLTTIDLSNNQCSYCGLFHTLHCPSELLKIQSTLVLYCNRCKCEHSYMNCVPFCNKCFRKHREGPCPEAFTFCQRCLYCHQGESCRYNNTPATSPEEIENSIDTLNL